jgi:hypothetical protein
LRKNFQKAARGVDGIVIPEIAVGEEDMAAHLSPQESFFLFHLLFEKGMSGLSHYAAAAMPGNIIIQILGAFYLGHNRGSWMMAKDFSGKEDQKLVAPDDVALIVGDPDSVRVSIITNPQIGSLLLDCLDQILHILGNRRVRVVVGKTPVDLGVKLDYFAAQVSQNLGSHQPGCPIAAIQDDPELFLEADVAHHEFMVGRDHLPERDGSLRLGKFLGFNDSAEVLNLFPIERFFAHADFESVEFRRIVAAGDHHPSLPIQVEKRKIEDWRGADADVYHVQTSGHHPLNQVAAEPRRTQPSIPPYYHFALSDARQVGGKPLANETNHLIR